MTNEWNSRKKNKKKLELGTMNDNKVSKIYILCIERDHCVNIESLQKTLKTMDKIEFVTEQTLKFRK